MIWLVVRNFSLRYDSRSHRIVVNMSPLAPHRIMQSVHERKSLAAVSLFNAGISKHVAAESR